MARINGHLNVVGHRHQCQRTWFWQIDRSFIAPCCVGKLSFIRDTIPDSSITSARPPQQNDALIDRGAKIINDHADATSPEPSDVTKADYKHKCLVAQRMNLWAILENQTDSKIGLAFMGISLGFIIATVLILVLSSIRQFQTKNAANDTVPLPSLEIGDTVCVGWFTLEYLARCFAAPSLWEYVKSPLSLIDLFAVAPFYLETGFALLGFQSDALAQLRRSFVLIRILRVLRVLRVLRILKVARYSRGFQSMGHTLQRSWRELLLLILFMFTTNIMFSTAMFFLEESDPDSMFHSIPGASWWCMITMTTVGYGDVYPVTVAGKILACLASISGIILLAFPISVIVDNFNQEYVDTSEEDQKLSNSSTPLNLDQTLSTGNIKNIDGTYYLELSVGPPKKVRAKTKFY